jgi:hypothetical protein
MNANIYKLLRDFANDIVNDPEIHRRLRMSGKGECQWIDRQTGEEEEKEERS